MYHPSRGGVRGGRDQFNWDDVKGDKHRENYLGHSVKAPVGRWQKGKDLYWYTRDNIANEASKDEIKRIQQEEEEAMQEMLGLSSGKKKRSHTNPLDKREVRDLLKRGKTGEELTPYADGERIEGLGFTRRTPGQNEGKKNAHKAIIVPLSDHTSELIHVKDVQGNVAQDCAEASERQAVANRKKSMKDTGSSNSQDEGALSMKGMKEKRKAKELYKDERKTQKQPCLEGGIHRGKEGKRSHSRLYKQIEDEATGRHNEQASSDHYVEINGGKGKARYGDDQSDGSREESYRRRPGHIGSEVSCWEHNESKGKARYNSSESDGSRKQRGKRRSGHIRMKDLSSERIGNRAKAVHDRDESDGGRKR